MEDQDSRPTAEETPKVGSTTYQMTLAGLTLPLRWHVAANVLGAACLAMVGHPVVAAFAFIGYCVVDFLNTRLVAHWIRNVEGMDPEVGFRRASALSAARVPVITESGPGGGCRLMDGYRFPLRGLRPEEAEALLVLGVPAAVRELGLDGALTAAHRQIQVTAGLTAAALVHLDMPRWFGGQEAVPCLGDLARAPDRRAEDACHRSRRPAGAGISGQSHQSAGLNLRAGATAQPVGCRHEDASGAVSESGPAVLHQRDDHEGNRRHPGNQRKPRFADPQSGARKNGHRIAR